MVESCYQATIYGGKYPIVVIFSIVDAITNLVQLKMTAELMNPAQIPRMPRLYENRTGEW